MSTARGVVFTLAGALLLASAGPAAPQAASPSPVPSPKPEILAAGETVPPFDVEALDGSTRHIDYPKGSTTILMFFLSSCPTCHKQIPQWNRAYAKHAPNLTIVGVMLDRESPEFFQLTPISFPVVRPPKDPEFRKAYKISRVPLTVRIGPGGKVEDADLGLLDDIRMGQLFRP